MAHTMQGILFRRPNYYSVFWIKLIQIIKLLNHPPPKKNPKKNTKKQTSGCATGHLTFSLSDTIVTKYY